MEPNNQIALYSKSSPFCWSHAIPFSHQLHHTLPLAEQLRQQILTYAGWRQAFRFNFSQGEVNDFSVTNPESPIQNHVKGDSCTYRLYLQKPKSV